MIALEMTWVVETGIPKCAATYQICRVKWRYSQPFIAAVTGQNGLYPLKGRALRQGNRVERTAPRIAHYSSQG
jgi:hypothetical protein